VQVRGIRNLNLRVAIFLDEPNHAPRWAREHDLRERLPLATLRAQVSENARRVRQAKRPCLPCRSPRGPVRQASWCFRGRCAGTRDMCARTSDSDPRSDRKAC
jgi:hypothetical protein